MDFLGFARIQRFDIFTADAIDDKCFMSSITLHTLLLSFESIISSIKICNRASDKNLQIEYQNIFYLHSTAAFLCL